MKVSMSLIQQLFPIFADFDNFLDLDFYFVKKILSSSGLNIDSELQVFNAADSWLSHDINERSKYANDLLSMVRLPLLSISALKQVFNRVSTKYNESGNTIEAILDKKQQLHPLSCNITSRYCNQTNFNIVVCGGISINIESALYKVKLLNEYNLSEVNNLPHMNRSRCFSGVACVNGEIYVLGGLDYNDNIVRSIEKYSPVTNSWKYLNKMIDNRKHFSTCSLMDNLYIIGGLIGNYTNGHALENCFEFNTKNLKWKELSKMNNARRDKDCSVFEGRIVVSGGRNNFGILNTVEAYDHVGDTWENMPNMINERCGHKSVAVKNKLFVIGGLYINYCEVFDSTTNKFSQLKQPTLASGFDLYRPFGVITNDSKIYVFQNNNVKIYDFKSNEWSIEKCEATKNIDFFSVMKYL